MAAFVKGVDDYQDFLRATVAFPGNDHRLGAQEAPPAVLSIFLGDELSAVVDSIINDTDFQSTGTRPRRLRGRGLRPMTPRKAKAPRSMAEWGSEKTGFYFLGLTISRQSRSPFSSAWIMASAEAILVA